MKDLVNDFIYPTETEQILQLKPYHGIGDIYRCYSQYRLMKLLEKTYKFQSVVEVPYDHSTMGVDHNIFRCMHSSFRDFNKLKGKPYDLVFNFSFLQRDPSIIFEMKKVSRRYILVFVPNGFNPGMIFHNLYHRIYAAPCNHPEQGDPKLMTLDGLRTSFHGAGIKVLEMGYIDVPPWPDTVVTLTELLGSSSRKCMKLPFPKPLLYFEKLGRKLGKFLAHHLYVFGEKN